MLKVTANNDCPTTYNITNIDGSPINADHPEFYQSMAAAAAMFFLMCCTDGRIPTFMDLVFCEDKRLRDQI